MAYLQELVCQALKGGFGLKDAPRLWKKMLERILLKYGCTRSRYDECLFHLYRKHLVQQELERLRKLQQEDAEPKRRKIKTDGDKKTGPGSSGTGNTSPSVSSQ